MELNASGRPRRSTAHRVSYREGWEGETDLSRLNIEPRVETFRADLVPLAAFPSLPLNHPGLGPSEAVVAAEVFAAIAALDARNRPVSADEGSGDARTVTDEEDDAVIDARGMDVVEPDIYNFVEGDREPQPGLAHEADWVDLSNTMKIVVWHLLEKSMTAPKIRGQLQLSHGEVQDLLDIWAERRYGGFIDEISVHEAQTYLGFMGFNAESGRLDGFVNKRIRQSIRLNLVEGEGDEELVPGWRFRRDGVRRRATEPFASAASRMVMGGLEEAHAPAHALGNDIQAENRLSGGSSVQNASDSISEDISIFSSESESDAAPPPKRRRVEDTEYVLDQRGPRADDPRLRNRAAPTAVALGPAQSAPPRRQQQKQQKQQKQAGAQGPAPARRSRVRARPEQPAELPRRPQNRIGGRFAPGHIRDAPAAQRPPP